MKYVRRSRSPQADQQYKFLAHVLPASSVNPSTGQRLSLTWLCQRQDFVCLTHSPDFNSVDAEVFALGQHHMRYLAIADCAEAAALN